MSASSTSLQLHPQLEELERIVGMIEVFCEQQDLGPKDAYALNLAVEELFANTVKHSHPPATLVELTLSREDGAVAVIYADDGPPFDPTLRAAVDTTLSVHEREIGGLGIHFILTTMADFGYQRRDGLNVTSFRRKLPS